MSPFRNATNIRYLFSSVVEAASSGGSVHERTDRIARLLAGHIDLDEHSMEELDHLFDDVVYVVFNIPERIEDHIKRLFTVIMNPKLVTTSNDLLARISRTKTTETASRADQAPVIYRDKSQTDQQRLDLISSSWQRAWQEYADLTRKLQDRGVYTWNQFLLHGAGRPRPLGVVWSALSDESMPVDYFKLEADVLETIGLPPETPSEATRNDLLCELPLDRELWNFSLPDDIIERWMRMRGNDATIDLESCAKAGTYHLLRSYSCWGGSAFLSLPITIAAGNDDGDTSSSSRMVISVCSNRPLNDREILVWESLGHFVFPQLASGDLVMRHQAVAEQRERFLMQTRNLAHEIKNHTTPIMRDVRLGVKYLKKNQFDAFSDTKEVFSRARRRLLLTNATACAIQFAVDQAPDQIKRNRKMKQRLLPLHRRSYKTTIEAVLQLALSEISERRKEFTILYSPVWSPEELESGILELIPEEDRSSLVFLEDYLEAAVSANRFVWVYALLREVLSNINTKGEKTIDLKYSIDLNGDWACLEIIQSQVEVRKLEFDVPPDGIKTTNDIFGPDHAGIGYIDCGEIRNTKRSDGKYDFRFVVTILFKVEEDVY